MRNHLDYLKRALELAQNVKGLCSPNPAVGAVIVKDGTIVGEGATQKAGCDHAEVVAIKQAGESAKGATLYVTLEPCCIFGRTPPCTDLIIKSKIKKVYIAVLDPNPKINGKGKKILEDAGIEVESNFLEKEINELNEDFYKYIQTGIPFCVAKYAMTLDGKMATESGDSKWISNEFSREWVHKLRNRVDAILVGVNTVINDNPLLNVRLSEKHKDPVRIILDSSGRCPIDRHVFQTEHKSIFVIKSNIDQDHYLKFQKNCEDHNKILLVDETSGKKISFAWLLKELGKLEISSILIEGGAEVLAGALEEKAIDKLHCFIAPKIVKGSGMTPFKGVGPLTMDQAYQLENVSHQLIENDILITGYFNYKDNDSTK